MTDRQTDRILLAIPRLHYMQRGKKKSCCIWIGPRNDHICANITTSQGHCLPWTNEIRYLGTYIAKSRQFRCSIDHAKKSFSSAHSIFGKIGRTASEEVTLELLRIKMYSCVNRWPRMFFITKK